MITLFAFMFFGVSYDIEANLLIRNPSGEAYPNRATAIRMDDCYPLREALKRQAVAMGVCDPPDALAFDRGFGTCFMALNLCRECWEENQKRKIKD